MITIQDLEFGYPDSGFRLSIAAERIERGERVALVGPSGSGKTTLISLIAGILTPRTGRVVVDDVELSATGDERRRAFRIAHIGFVFQEFELLDYLSVRDNILLPYYVSDALRLDDAVRRRAASLAEALRIGDKLRRFPRKLSQGERQRVAICRALATQPKLLIADEPTGSLDAATANIILRELFDMARAHDATLIVVTHNRALLTDFDRTLDMAQFAAAAAS
jgi:putative ABC transport system ATP-binding protein